MSDYLDIDILKNDIVILKGFVSIVKEYVIPTINKNKEKYTTVHDIIPE